MSAVPRGYTRHMSDPMSGADMPPPADADRTVDDADEALDPEAPTDSPVAHPPLEDADRPADDPEDLLQEENAGTSLDQPSDGST